MDGGDLMKIGVILGGFPKLSETFILGRLTGVVDLGHEVGIFAKRAERTFADVI